MVSFLVVLYAIAWTVLYSVAALWFNISALTIHFGLAMVVWTAMHRPAASTYLVSFVLALFTTLLSGGGRGPALLVTLAFTALAIATRQRNRNETRGRLAITVMTGTLLWSLLFALMLSLFSGNWLPLFARNSMLSAALTGLWTIPGFWLFELVTGAGSRRNEKSVELRARR